MHLKWTSCFCTRWLALHAFNAAVSFFSHISVWKTTRSLRNTERWWHCYGNSLRRKTSRWVTTLPRERRKRKTMMMMNSMTHRDKSKTCLSTFATFSSIGICLLCNFYSISQYIMSKMLLCYYWNIIVKWIYITWMNINANINIRWQCHCLIIFKIYIFLLLPRILGYIISYFQFPFFYCHFVRTVYITYIKQQNVFTYFSYWLQYIWIRASGSIIGCSCPLIGSFNYRLSKRQKKKKRQQKNVNVSNWNATFKPLRYLN